MRQVILLCCLLSPMVQAIGVIQSYKDFKQSQYDQNGELLYRLAVDEYRENFLVYQSRGIENLFTIRQLQSQMFQLGKGTILVANNSIHFHRGSVSGGDMVLMNAYGELAVGRFTAPQINIRLHDMRLSAPHILITNAQGRMIAHRRHYQTLLR